jgi:hypothetical protein
MTENIQLSPQVVNRLRAVADGMAVERGRTPTIEEVIVALLEVYSKGNVADPARIDMLIDVWDKLTKLEARVSEIEHARGIGASSSRTSQPQYPSAAAGSSTQPVPASSRVHSQLPSAEAPLPKSVVAVPRAGVVSPSSSPVPAAAGAPRVQLQPKSDSKEQSPTGDKFLEFMQSVVVYPMEKIRKPREQINAEIKAGTFEVMEVGGSELLIYKPALQEFSKKLPLPIADKAKLTQKERKLLETLSTAGLIFEDSSKGQIREV